MSNDFTIQVPCSKCGSAAGRPCYTKSGNRASYTHAARYWLAKERKLLPWQQEEVKP